MKKLVLFFLFLGVITVSQAQFSFGLRGGLNFSRLPSQTFPLQDPETRIKTLSDSYTGYHVGAMAQISLLGVFLMPELLFVSTGHDLVLEREEAEDEYFQQRFSQIDVPIMVGAKIGPMRAGLGPVATYVINSSTNLDREYGYRQRFNSATWGFQLGAGVNLGNLAFDLKYQFGLSRLGKGIQFGEGENQTTFDFDTRPRQWVFSIGLLF